jgi:hypothetical protein
MIIHICNTDPTARFEDLSGSSTFYMITDGRVIVEADGVTIRTFVGYHSAADIADRIRNGFEAIVTARPGVARFSH